MSGTGAGGDASAAETGGGEPLLRVVKGDPTAEELAALVAVLAALDGPAAAPRRRTPVWNAPRRQVRSTHRHGVDAWRASSLPR